MDSRTRGVQISRVKPTLLGRLNQLGSRGFLNLLYHFLHLSLGAHQINPTLQRQAQIFPFSRLTAIPRTCTRHALNRNLPKVFQTECRTACHASRNQFVASAGLLVPCRDVAFDLKLVCGDGGLSAAMLVVYSEPAIYQCVVIISLQWSGLGLYAVILEGRAERKRVPRLVGPNKVDSSDLRTESFVRRRVTIEAVSVTNEANETGSSLTCTRRLASYYK
jgi:hypothetical protein